MCLVSVLDQVNGAVLGQVAVPEKGSVVAAFTMLLDDLDLADVLSTAAFYLFARIALCGSAGWVARGNHSG